MAEGFPNPHVPEFSDDPEKNLRIENEILKMKIQAESGAYMDSAQDIPPDIEHQFLQNVIRFENAWKNAQRVKVFDLVGRPPFKKEEELDDTNLAPEKQRLLRLLEDHSIRLEVQGEYEPRTIYQFITEELFEAEMDDIKLPGWTTNFIYEDFHPNHKMDIERTAIDFLGNWFRRCFNEWGCELCEQFILADGRIMPKQDVLEKLDHVFQSCSSFDNCRYFIAETSFQAGVGDGPLLGFAEGAVEYDFVTESGEKMPIEGPFKLYMLNEGFGWSIFYFVFPGFNW